MPLRFLFGGSLYRCLVNLVGVRIAVTVNSIDVRLLIGIITGHHGNDAPLCTSAEWRTTGKTSLRVFLFMWDTVVEIEV